MMHTVHALMTFFKMLGVLSQWYLWWIHCV